MPPSSGRDGINSRVYSEGGAEAKATPRRPVAVKQYFIGACDCGYVESCQRFVFSRRRRFEMNFLRVLAQAKNWAVSASGQKQTYAVQTGMSALPPKSGHVQCVKLCPLRAKSGHQSYRRLINWVCLPRSSHSKMRSSAFSSGWGESWMKCVSAVLYWQPTGKPPREMQKPDHIGGSARVMTAKSAVHAKMITAHLSTTPRVSSTMAFPTAL